jgi:pimeloyl-ACP methyl ester carboxylesterase
MPTAQINGTTIHYHSQGSGTPIVFIHPPLLTRENFTYQTVQLSDEFRVITFDIRGHGHSAPSKEPVTYPLIVEDMKQLLDFLEVDKAYLCGYSTGGSIVLEAMLTYPDRFLGGVVVSGMSEMTDWWNRSRLALAVGATKARAKDMVAAAITFGNADSRITYNNLYRDAINGNVTNWKQYYAYSLVYNCTAKLNAIKAPMLLIYGGKDISFHRYAKILQSRLPWNELHYIDKAPHQLPTKHALHMNELIRNWLDRLEPAESTEAAAGAREYMDTAIANPNGAEIDQELR